MCLWHRIRDACDAKTNGAVPERREQLGPARRRQVGLDVAPAAAAKTALSRTIVIDEVEFRFFPFPDIPPWAMVPQGLNPPAWVISAGPSSTATEKYTAVRAAVPLATAVGGVSLPVGKLK